MISTCLLLCFSGCAAETAVDYPEVTAIPGLTLSVDSSTSTNAVIEMKNETDSAYTYGAWFRLEKKSKENWVPLSPIDDVVWSQEDWGKTLHPGAVENVTYTWDWYYGNLRQGEYRIILNLFDQNQREHYFLPAYFSAS